MTGWRATLRGVRGRFTLDVELRGGAGVHALVGPNGSGKTTVLRALAGAVDLAHTEIVVTDRVWARSHPPVFVPIERRRVGYVPQGFGLFPHLPVIDNVAFGLASGPHRLPRAERHARARTLLNELGIGSVADRAVAALSGGEQQRVALARALAPEPTLLLLDEPLAALDAVTRRDVRQFLAEHLRALGCPTVLSTHDVQDVRALNAEVTVIEQGQVVQTGPLAELSAAPSTRFVAAFVEGATG